MRGSIFTVVAVGAGAALTPVILGVDVTGDTTGQTVVDLLSPFADVVGLAFGVVAFGLLVAWFTDGGM